MAAVAIAFAASGFADPTKGATSSKRAVAKKPAHHKCFVTLSSSPFPQPCDRLGAVPSTASPMIIIGQAPPMRHTR
jgi:hypothetical protein